MRQERKKIVEFYQTWSPERSSDLTLFGVLTIRSKQNIEHGVELYMHYGRSYNFTGTCCKDMQFIQFFFFVMLRPGWSRRLVGYRESCRKYYLPARVVVRSLFTV